MQLLAEAPVSSLRIGLPKKVVNAPIPTLMINLGCQLDQIMESAKRSASKDQLKASPERIN